MNHKQENKQSVEGFMSNINNNQENKNNFCQENEFQNQKIKLEIPNDQDISYVLNKEKFFLNKKTIKNKESYNQQMQDIQK